MANSILSTFWSHENFSTTIFASDISSRLVITRKGGEEGVKLQVSFALVLDRVADLVEGFFNTYYEKTWSFVVLNYLSRDTQY